ncbi:MAG: DNA mismatch repair protein MutS [Candidatus Moraniibacteriota bacterium]|jgi:DNA mismatch repair protein MutS
MQKFNTPMMQQYSEIKEQYQDCLLFFRLGDFYELFLEDAKVGAAALEITLTKRPRGKDGEIPMAGVPHHAADAYIAKLVKSGHKVAICEQMSEPTGKGIVDREVVRVITPGTILDEKNLDKKKHNFIISLVFRENKIAIAAVDLSTGDMFVTDLNASLENVHLLNTELLRFGATECILNKKDYNNPQVLKTICVETEMNIYPFVEWDEYAVDKNEIVKEQFKIASLEVFSLHNKEACVEAIACLLGYLRETQKDKIAHLKSLNYYRPEEYLVLDRSTIQNLEIFDTLRTRDDKGTLVEVIDKTVTAMGGRLLREYLKKPLIDIEKIKERHEAVGEMITNRAQRNEIREKLKQICDIPRLIARLSMGNGNAYDLKNLAEALEHARAVLSDLEQFEATALQFSASEQIDKIISLINEQIVDDPPLDIKSGGMIKTGFHGKLDDLRENVTGNKDWIVKMEEQEREKTGISSLKVRYNRVFGYYIEVTKANVHLVPINYIRKQTMVSAERYITPDLKEYEQKVLVAQERINKIEYDLFLNLVDEILKYTKFVQSLAHDLSTVDCLGSFAELAEQENYICPTMSSDDELHIVEGRHPVVEKYSTDQFIANDTKLNAGDHQLLVLTGPNMAGKSVYMRQVAVITLLAHVGSFVPASEATISMVDRIFVRSGAADFIASGLSTFMVEMTETAHILHHATDKSLIIMDEIGRGTSTYDGISIAWAIAEFLVTTKNKNAKTLFATHYHELQTLEEKFPKRIKNYEVVVMEKDDGEPVFLHKVRPGKASHSYAIAVAKLAGVPDLVNNRAVEILDNLEKKVFNDEFEKKPKTQSSKIEKELKDLSIDQMTPIEALNKLSELKKRC